MAPSRTFTYRLLKSSWGILISVTAEAVSVEGDGMDAIPLGTGVWLADDTADRSLSGPELDMFARGLYPLVSEIASVASGDPITIAIRELRYNECDFQQEGLAAAIFGWAIAEFGLTQREISAVFDREHNRYVFDLPEREVG